MKVAITQTKQTGNEALGTPDKILYYLILGEKPDMTVINVGEKTYNGVAKQLEKENKKK